MTIKEILDIADAAYPDDCIRPFYDEDGLICEHEMGDGLARFIVSELTSTYEQVSASWSEINQLQVARNTMHSAHEELQDVENAFGRILARKESGV